ncbi:MAG: YidC/Oxa1 family membrane protein insertase [Candidatus Margulisbacteria bacterium]|nr:YidC/Oxa1 family membrane protein insertase [Candidatus Margulisiibacteriota bacterium]MBU1616697.1 YidC/Oxa1 family membrane protein insertase [Candidatus Margulisiibacteriota bacterium]
MDYLVNIMLEVVKFFYAIGGHNYGLAIIWLTVAVNIALYPLTVSSIQQMAAMQRIQPMMKNIQEKHKENPQQLQKEMMDLYKIEKVNPLGGCLPMLLKIPVFLALFFALQSKEFLALIGNSNSFLWINNIAKPDPTFIMVVLIAISTYLMQKSMPNAGSGGQMQIMTWMMPIFIAFISISFSAGLQIYWVVSNLVGWGQQTYIINRANRKG